VSDDAITGMMTGLTEEPLPSDEQVESMLSEIRSLEQDETLVNEQVEELDVPRSTKDELQAILSSIPSFSEINKKK
ncbi:MAG: hypothetical protein P1P93_06040, partial [Gammaproteobacteria bacterium]|nr:hypothetical protein [Gammaproteobacteria bacterium]